MNLSLINIYEIVGIVITAITAIYTYARSSDDAKDRKTAITSVIGILLTVCLGIRLELIPKLQAEVAEAEAIRRDPARRELFEKVSATRTTLPPSDSLLAKVMKVRVASLSDQFNQINSGRFIVDEAEMPLFNLEMISGAKVSVKATNYIGLSKWWELPWGSRYEAANEAAVRRKVKISRVFIFANAKDLSIAKSIMDEEKTAGIDVRYALSGDLPPFTGDVVIIDGILAGEHHIAPDHGLSEALFSLNTVDVSRASHSFDEIETNSHDWLPHR